MLINEFVEATSVLEKYYEKEYTTDQRQIMFEELKDLSIARYKKLISECIRSCKYLPKVADIIAANTQKIDITNEKRKIYECDKCNSSGYICYSKIIQDGNKVIPYTFVARCVCENANYANKTIPTFEELGIDIGNRLKQVEDINRDIEKIKEMLRISYKSEV